MNKIILRSYFLYLPLFLFMIGCNKNCFDALVFKKNHHEIHMAKRISEGELESGLKYYFLRNENPKNQCLLRLNVGVGSFYESTDELGMAHMIGHLAFVDRPISQGENLRAWLQNHGQSLARDALVQTAYEGTLYQINLPHCNEKDVADALSIFRGIADGLSLTEEAIREENNIIDAEDKDYHNKQSKLAKRLVEYIYSGTSYISRPTLGKAAVRAQFTKDALTAFYQKWYHPKNLSIVLVGDYGDLKLADMINNTFASITNKTKPPIAIKSNIPDYQHPVFIINEPEIPYIEVAFSIQTKKIENPHFTPALIKDRVAFDIALDLVSDTLKAQAKKHPDLIMEPDINGLVIDKAKYELTLTVAGNADNFEQSFKDAFAVLNHAAEKGFLEDEFINAKNAFADEIDQWVVGEINWTSDIWINQIMSHINHTTYAYDAEDYRSFVKPILASLTAKDCQKALKAALKSGNHYIFAYGSIEESDKNIKQLTDLLADAKAQKIETQAAITPPAFPYHVPPCEEATLTKNYIKDIDAYQLTLSNGIHVILKSTTFSHDEVMLRIFSDEGYRTMDKTSFDTARLATSVLSEGELDKYPGEQLSALLKEKSVVASLQLLNDRIQASVTTKNQDLRFALEYIKALITNPLYAESNLNRIKEQIKMGYKELEHKMWAPLLHDFVKAMTNDDFRVGRAELLDLLKISKDDLLAWHQKYISSKKPTIVVVGDFDRDKVAQGISCVFGQLPIFSSPHGNRPLPLTFKSGVTKIYQVKTKAEDSKIALRYPLNYPSGNSPDHKLGIIKNLIRERLRPMMREKNNLAPALTIEISESHDLLIPHWVDIVVPAPKSQAIQVQQKVKEILGSLAKNGIKTQDLIKVREPYLAEAKLTNVNNYWADLLAQNASKLDTLTWLKTLEADIKAVTVKDINQLLRHYFTPSKASSAIVNAVDG